MGLGAWSPYNLTSSSPVIKFWGTAKTDNRFDAKHDLYIVDIPVPPKGEYTTLDVARDVAWRTTTLQLTCPFLDLLLYYSTKCFESSHDDTRHKST